MLMPLPLLRPALAGSLLLASAASAHVSLRTPNGGDLGLMLSAWGSC